MPWKISRRCLPPSCSNGTSSGHARAAARRRPASRRRGGCRRSGQRATAPWASVSFGSRSKAAGLVPVCVPSPSQAGHQPSGLLKEKLCGESGSKLRPQRSQAKCWLWISTGHCGSGTSVAADRPRAARRGPAPGRSPRCRRSASGRRRESSPGRSPLRRVLPPPVDLRRLVDASRSGRRRGSRT